MSLLRTPSPEGAVLLLVSAAAILVAGIAPSLASTDPPPLPAAPPPGVLPPLRLLVGTDPHGYRFLHEQGVRSDFVQVWAGAWLDRGGWSHVDAVLRGALMDNVTPVVQFYYWGDDLTQACFLHGCTVADGVRKDHAGWDRIATELGRRLAAEMGSRPVVVVLESEFNKELRENEDLDLALAAKAEALRTAYPPVRVALGFGNWGRESWPTFDRAAAASDEVSLQLLRASTRHDPGAYATAAEDLLAGARELQRLFRKPIIVSDIALSTFGGPAYEQIQRQVLDRVFELAHDLEGAGVYGLVYRSVFDATKAPLSGHFGEGERHFGLVWSGNRTAKPGFDAWREGVMLVAGP